MSSTTNKETIHHQGWLTKSPPAKAIFRPRWRRRWFILKSGSYPNQFVLEYFTDESCRRQKGLINLDECEQISGPLNVQDRHKHTFQLRTPNRMYYLAADNESEMSRWIEGLCQVCGLKMIEDDNDGSIVYAKPSLENNQSHEGVVPEGQNESEGGSPTPSNKSPSGPYILVSQCVTGTRIPWECGGQNGNEEVTYYNTIQSSFPFPPVNWATHPHKKESKDGGDGAANDGKQGQRPADATYAPPRPPKKSSSKPTTPTTTAQPKSSCSPKNSEDSQAVQYVGIYENVDENPDSSSPSSSLHSPPGSAGGLYCNIPDTTNSESKTVGTPLYQNPQPSSSPNPATTSGNSASAIPPKVDRNLKPEVKKASEINAASKNQPSTSSEQSRQGCMTLPNKSSQNNFYRGEAYPGPEIDRTRKPSDGSFTLSSTPAQLKYNSTTANNSRGPTNSGMNARTNTLPIPNSSKQRTGPLILPHDKKGSSYTDGSSQGLSGTYMQIDCTAIREHERSPTLKVPTIKKPGAPGAPVDGAVEYRLIDHVKTRALNQMRMDREQQLKQNTSRH